VLVESLDRYSQNMQGLKIKDLRRTEHGGYLSFDLKEIFSAIGAPVLISTWRCHNVECIGENAPRLHELSERGQCVSGEELVEIVAGIFQTIDGEFAAHRDGKDEPWFVVNAVDSSWFEVLSLDPAVLETIRSGFKDVSELPPQPNKASPADSVELG
jgi:hypothetical protein